MCQCTPEVRTPWCGKGDCVAPDDDVKILRVLVGSHAHGLSTPESDYDYRGVFLTPTTKILSLGGNTKQTSWIEGKEDDTAWELAHFLHLATKCNPTILETFLAPRADVVPIFGDDGERLRNLFPHVWNSVGVMNAFVGYGLNQRKKFLEEKDGRPHKFAAAYLRSLYNGWQLLTEGTFTVKISETEIGETVRRFKNGEYSFGEVIDTCRKWEKMVKDAYEANPNKQTNVKPVNDFLLEMREKYWV